MGCADCQKRTEALELEVLALRNVLANYRQVFYTLAEQGVDVTSATEKVVNNVQESSNPAETPVVSRTSLSSKNPRKSNR